MKKRKSVSASFYRKINLIIILALAFISSGCNITGSTADDNTSQFGTRSGSQLMVNGQPFRFSGANIHWLALDDSASYPSSFRVDDSLDMAKEMSATVIRSHSLGISTGCSNCIEPSLGVFNETAFEHVDYVIKAAKARDLRLIIPLTDNWHFAHGGKHNFTDWRGIADENQFYYNKQVINDFEIYISTLLNHVNKYTGVAYKNDPTIIAWETGNEVDPPTSWTQTISTYIKSVDEHHLVMDGKNGIDPAIVSLNNVDIVTNHYYPMNVSKIKTDAAIAENADRIFITGEFNWNDKNQPGLLSNFLSTIEADSAVTGDLFWELWSHSDQYGYVSNQPEYTLHYPGDSEAMRASVQQLRTHAYKMREATPPTDSIPGSPFIETIKRSPAVTITVIEWRGTAVAASYSIERSTSSVNGPWTIICNKCATDLNTPWRDSNAPLRRIWYRVTAYNIAGVAGKPSAPYEIPPAN